MQSGGNIVRILGSHIFQNMSDLLVKHSNGVHFFIHLQCFFLVKLGNRKRYKSILDGLEYLKGKVKWENVLRYKQASLLRVIKNCVINCNFWKVNTHELLNLKEKHITLLNNHEDRLIFFKIWT